MAMALTCTCMHWLPVLTAQFHVTLYRTSQLSAFADRDIDVVILLSRTIFQLVATLLTGHNMAAIWPKIACMHGPKNGMLVCNTYGIVSQSVRIEEEEVITSFQPSRATSDVPKT